MSKMDSHPTSLSSKHMKKIPDDFFIHGLCIKEDHGWTAVLLDFDVAGVGSSPPGALKNALTSLDDYLELCFDEGLSFEDALRPAPDELQRKFQRAMQAALKDATPSEPSSLPPSMPAEAFRQPIYC